MNLKKILASLLAVAVMGASVPTFSAVVPNISVTASAAEYNKEKYGDYTIYKYSDHVEISKYNGESTNIEIPSEMDGLSVTGIVDAAFSHCTNLNSVTIPNSVTSIGDSAFSGCESLTVITIPNSVKYISFLVFNNCTSLSSITIPESVMNIGMGAFFGCEKLESITILNPECKIIDKSYTICNSADYNKEIEDYVGAYSGIIKGCSGSTAESYAKKYGYKFERLSNKPLNGDVDGDEKITANDASLVLTEYASLSSGKITFTPEQIALADVDEDGKITANDASNILTFYAYLSGNGTEKDIKVWMKNLNS